MATSHYRRTHFCRLCARITLTPAVSLGNQYVVDFPQDSWAQTYQAPLHLAMCGYCGLLQLQHTVDRDLMYRQYYYRSSTSRTMRAALHDIVDAAVKVVLKPERVLDIGANDGCLLGYYNQDVFKVAVEPSQLCNEIESASTVVHDYFGYNTVKQWAPYDVVTSIACFYDVERPLDFMADVADVLDRDGVWINQMNYAPDMLDNNSYDMISHEHLTYWTTPTFADGLSRVGLEIFQTEHLPLNGGTMRYYIGHRGKHLVDRDIEMRILQPSKLAEWRTHLLELAGNLKSMVQNLVADGKKVLVFGASTRGHVILQFSGLGLGLLAADADRNKWGRVMAGTNIPIISLEEARAMKPDYFLVLPYSYLDEFMVQEKEFRDRGGKFIVPLPEPRIV